MERKKNLTFAEQNKHHISVFLLKRGVKQVQTNKKNCLPVPLFVENQNTKEKLLFAFNVENQYGLLQFVYDFCLMMLMLFAIF